MFNPSIEPAVVEREPIDAIPAEDPPLLLSTERTEEIIDMEDGSPAEEPTQYTVAELLNTIQEHGIELPDTDDEEEFPAGEAGAGLGNMDEEEVLAQIEAWEKAQADKEEEKAEAEGADVKGKGKAKTTDDDEIPSADDEDEGEEEGAETMAGAAPKLTSKQRKKKHRGGQKRKAKAAAKTAGNGDTTSPRTSTSTAAADPDAATNAAIDAAIARLEALEHPTAADCANATALLAHALDPSLSDAALYDTIAALPTSALPDPQTFQQAANRTVERFKAKTKAGRKERKIDAKKLCKEAEEAEAKGESYDMLGRIKGLQLGTAADSGPLVVDDEEEDEGMGKKDDLGEIGGVRKKGGKVEYSGSEYSRDE